MSRRIGARKTSGENGGFFSLVIGASLFLHFSDVAVIDYSATRLSYCYERDFAKMKKNADKNTKPTKKSPHLHMELESGVMGMSLFACGVREIQEYSEAMLSMKIMGGCMHIKGQGLCLSIFENKTVEVHGRILEVSFSYDRN